MNGKVTKVLRYVISILLAAALLAFAFWKVNWGEFLAALKACKWEYVILSMAIGVVAFLFRALRWRNLLLPIDPSTSRLTCFNAVNISYVINMILPKVGEFARCGFITARSRKDPDAPEGSNRRLASYDKVLGTAVIERTYDMVAMVLVLGLFLLFTWKRFGAFFTDKIFGSASDGFTMGRVIVAAALVLAVAAFVVCVKLFADRWTPLARVRDFCKGIWQGILSCFRMKGAWKVLFQTAVVWLCYWMMSATILWAVQGMDTSAVTPGMADCIARIRDLGLVDALFLMLAGGLSSLVPVPGGFGAFHFIVAGALSSVYGIPFEFGMILATLSHESQAVNQIICGGLSYLNETTRKKPGTDNN